MNLYKKLILISLIILFLFNILNCIPLSGKRDIAESDTNLIFDAIVKYQECLIGLSSDNLFEAKHVCSNRFLHVIPNPFIMTLLKCKTVPFPTLANCIYDNGLEEFYKIQNKIDKSFNY